MSKAAATSPVSRPGRPAPVRGGRKGLNALEALERGLALFQSTFAREGWRYYIGSAPFVLCFIPMWVINGQIRLSSGMLLLEAALLAATYLLRACLVASYMERVRERAFGTPTSKTHGATAKVAAVARLLTWKITLSIGVLVALPTVVGPSWLYSACQFASLEAREDGAERHSISGCMALANQWFGAGLLLFFMLLPLWGAVWLNGFILAIILPQLLHSIFGLNTLLSTSMGLFALIRSSAFWLALFAGAWLALDPIVKCSFVVVCQHLRSRREGDDLRGLLASLPRDQKKKAQMIASTAAAGKVIGALIVLGAMLGGVCGTATARTAQMPPASTIREAPADFAREARIQKLSQALDQESQRAIYRWHDAELPSPPTWFDKLLAKIGRTIGRAWETLVNFIRKLWPRGLSPSPDSGKRGWQLKDLRSWLTLIVIVTFAAVAVLLWLRRRREAVPLSIPMSVVPLPDLSEKALATARSEDEWFALAARLHGEGQLRLAVRAAYLGLLAGLGQREWLTIRRDRTNREYLDEFTRRWRRRPQAAVETRTEIPEKLRGSLRQFDRVWYGSYALTTEAVAAYRKDQRELLNRV